MFCIECIEKFSTFSYKNHTENNPEIVNQLSSKRFTVIRLNITSIQSNDIYTSVTTLQFLQRYAKHNHQALQRALQNFVTLKSVAQ